MAWLGHMHFHIFLLSLQKVFKFKFLLQVHVLCIVVACFTNEVELILLLWTQVLEQIEVESLQILDVRILDVAGEALLRIFDDVIRPWTGKHLLLFLLIVRLFHAI